MPDPLPLTDADLDHLTALCRAAATGSIAEGTAATLAAIGFCAVHLPLLRAELAAHRKNRWLALDDNSPHDDPADCPSWYDWCNCTVASLRSASDLAMRQRSELDTLRAELAACREALGPLADLGGELLRQNGGAAESCGCYVGGRHLVAAHRALTSARAAATPPASPAAPELGSAGEPPAAPGPGPA